LCDGATQREFDRAITRMKSRLVMSGESTPARAGAIGYDYFRLGRARTLDERIAQIDAVSLDQLNDYLTERAVGPFTIVSIGPQPLQAPPTVESETPAPIDQV
jgi:predicted Zn-dependent peptidase